MLTYTQIKDLDKGIRLPDIQSRLPFSKHIQHSARNKKAAENIDARQ